MIIINECLENLYRYSRIQGYKGYDPYDGLNSPILKYLSCRILRQLWTQLFKYSPYNLRRIFCIKKEYNSKCIALFILGLLKLYNKSQKEEYLDEAYRLLRILESLILKGYSGNCWGYNFPWQSRSFFIPKDTPNAICSVFSVEAFLRAYDIFKENKFLDIAKGAIGFFLNDIKRDTDKSNESYFTYTPLDNSQIHNINFLVCYILANLNYYLNDRKIRESIDMAIKFSIGRQNPGGSWYYGTAMNQKWIDNFHTCYNLIALKKYIDLTGNFNFRKQLDIGYKFYDDNFLLHTGIPKYYSNRIFPIDIHSVAMSIITYLEFADYDNNAKAKAEKVLSWAVRNMLDKKGYFYFQFLKFYKIKIPYIRWSQAWMFYALSCC